MRCGKNIAEPDRQQIKKLGTRIECWIPKSLQTHSEYVILIVFPL